MNPPPKVAATPGPRPHTPTPDSQGPDEPKPDRAEPEGEDHRPAQRDPDGQGAPPAGDADEYRPSTEEAPRE